MRSNRIEPNEADNRSKHKETQNPGFQMKTSQGNKTQIRDREETFQQAQYSHTNKDKAQEYTNTMMKRQKERNHDEILAKIELAMEKAGTAAEHRKYRQLQETVAHEENQE